MKKLEPLVFFGTENFSAQVLIKLIEAGLKIEAIVTKPDFKKGRGQKLHSPLVKLVAQKHDLPVLTVTNRASILNAIKQTSCQTGILASFGKIIPPEVINSFKHGIINVHPSLLPKYRGPSPIEFAILNGDQETGVSIMQLVDKVDAGDVYAQSKINLTGRETKTDLYERLAQEGAVLLINTLKQIETGLKPTPQDHTKASFTRIFTKKDSLLQPNQHTAIELERQIRAFIGFPKSRVQLENYNLIILAASADDKITSPLYLTCIDQSILNIHSVIAPSGKTMSAEDFSHGYQIN